MGANDGVCPAPLAVAALLLAAGLAGCIGGEESDPADAGPVNGTDALPDTNITTAPDAVIAFIDRGINPYHDAFQTDDPRAQHHPSTYLPDYPDGAEALNLTFDHDSLEDAIAADCQMWAGIDPGKLYWVPGTRVVGMTVPYVEEGNTVPGEDFSCDEESGDEEGDEDGDEWPVFLAGGGHGTEVASRGAGGEHGACPECLIVSAQRVGNFRNGVTEHTVQWAVDQPWIDVQSNSWEPGAPCPPVIVQNADCRGPGSDFLETVEEVASKQPVFWASGNGFFGGDYDYVGQPGQADPKNTPSVIRVGGHDNGHILLWPGSGPNIVSDACWSWAAEHESMNETTPRTGGGTSAAAPYAAGIAGNIVLEAREILDDDRTGVREGVLAQGEANSIEEGPLADGELTLDELKRVLYTTANPRPEATEDDGRFGCEFAGERRRGVWALPLVAWSDVPEGPAGIPLIGYGAVTPTTAEHAFQVLRGEEPMPERPAEDAYFEADRTQREAMHEVYTATGGQAVEVGR